MKGCPFSLFLPERWIHGYTSTYLRRGNVKMQLKGKTEARSAIAASKPSGVGERKQWQGYVVPIMEMQGSPDMDRQHSCLYLYCCTLDPEAAGFPRDSKSRCCNDAVCSWQDGKTSSWSPRCFLYLPGSSCVLCTSSKGHFYIKKILWVS